MTKLHIPTVNQTAYPPLFIEEIFKAIVRRSFEAPKSAESASTWTEFSHHIHKSITIFWNIEPNLVYTLHLLYIFCNTSYQYELLLNICLLTCGLTPCGRLWSIMLTPTIPLCLMEMSFFIFDLCLFGLHSLFQENNQSIKQGFFVQHSVKILNIVIWGSTADVVFVTLGFLGRYLRAC